MFCFDFHHAGDRRRGIAGSAEERGATHKGRAEGTEHARLLGASIETNDSLLELEQHFFLLMILSAFHPQDCLLSKRKARLASPRRALQSDGDWNLFAEIDHFRSEYRRVGKECVSTCRSRLSRSHTNKQKRIT